MGLGSTMARYSAEGVTHFVLIGLMFLERVE
jgi:hypothetical protein